MGLNWQITKFNKIPSTQTTLLDEVVLNKNLPEGSVIYTLEQSAGKARHGRTWQEGAGNLYFSFLLRPNCTASEIGPISLSLGLAVGDCINDIILPSPELAHRAIVKWPNDILIDNKKVSGMIINAAPINNSNKIEYIVVGIGINIASSPLNIATNIEEYCNYKVNIDNFLSKVLSYISNYYKQWQEQGFDKIREKWLDNSFNKGDKISVKTGNKHIKGSFETIDLYGNLVLISEVGSKKIKISSGDVFLL